MREILAKSYWLQILVVATAYVTVGELSLLLANPAALYGTIWPPSGIALAALLLGGRRLWPGVWLGSVAIAALTNPPAIDDPESLLRSAVIMASLGAAASLQAVLSATLVRRFVKDRNPLDRQRDVLSLLFWGAFAGCWVSATLGTLTLYFSRSVEPSSVLFSWGTWWIGDTIGTLIVAPLVLLWAERRPAWLRRRLSVTIPLVATFAVVILLFLFASRREEETMRAAFLERAQAFSSAIRESCEDHLGALRSLTLVLSMLPSIGPQEFQTVVAGVLDHSPGIQALSWNPRVGRAQRAALEARLGPAGFRITERDPEGRLRPAAPRDEHVPVLYIEPQKNNERALGFDVASEPVRREALERARDTGEVAATRRIRLVVQEGVEEHAVLLFSPVYASGSVPATREERRSQLRGYATAALRMDQLVNKAVKNQRLDGLTFALIDTHAAGTRRILFADSRWAQRLDDVQGLQWTESFLLGGHPWEIRVAALRSTLSPRRSWRSSLVLATGLVFTALLGAFLLVVTSRATQVEELVVRRTAELQQELVEHQRTEETLRASEARYRAIFDHMIGGMMTFDNESRVESVNPAAQRIFGYREEELVGRSVAILMADAPPDPSTYLRYVHGEAIGRVTEWQGRRKDGSVFPFEVALFGFDTPGGERFAANLQDISERREVDRLKSEFVATVSHELRTPLTSIRGSLGLLVAGVGGTLPDQGKELVRLAERNAVRLTALINDILDFERLDSGKVSMQFAVAGLQALVDQSFESVRAFADEQEISLVSRPTEVRVWADADRIVQVLVNLLSNAIKFSEAGREVRVWAEEQGSRILVFVKDQGRGIPTIYRQRIFERFVQVEASDMRDQGGTGLGLAICKAIVEHHGGRIGVESGEGVGSTFWFELPSALGSGV